MKCFFNRPKLSFFLLTGICLSAFWLSIPLPRVDNQLIGSDGIYYYVYLPSVLLDHDLDFTNEYTHFLPGINFSGNSLPPNKYPVGVSIFWGPFFILAHLFLWLLNVFTHSKFSMDGYGFIYQSFTLTGSILYGGFALWITYKFVRQSTGQSAALIATVLTVFSGNLVYYMVAEPSMSHTVSAFCSSLFFLIWSYRRDCFDLKTALLYGLMAGLGAFVSPREGVFFVLLF